MKKLIVLTVMAALFAGAAFAQGLPATGGGGFTSPQNAATQGRLRSAADDFIRPDAYAGVRFENWFGMASFASGTPALGYATKLGNLYLAAFYTGNFWANSQQCSYTKGNAEWLGVNQNDVKIYPATPVLSAGNPLNQGAILIGIADMGFRLTFTSTYKSFSDTDFLGGGNPAIDPVTASTLPFKSLKAGNGLISPQIAWSMSRNLLGDSGVRPWASVDLVFNNNFSKFQEYNQNDGGNWVAGNEVVNNSRNNILTEVNSGLGSFIIANNNGWRTALDLDYRLRIQSYNNEYSYNTNGFSKIANFSGDNFNGNLFGINHNDHRIRPSVATQWNGERLRLRAKLDLVFELHNTATTPKRIDYNDAGESANGALENHGVTSNLFSFRFNPDLALAAQWQISPVFFLNVGGRISANALRLDTTTGETYDNGNLVANSSYETVSSSFGTSATNLLNIGVTINATDNMFIEASTGVTSGANISLFDNLSTFSRFLVGLRF
jgi:hypothetical protein